MSDFLNIERADLGDSVTFSRGEYLTAKKLASNRLIFLVLALSGRKVNITLGARREWAIQTTSRQKYGTPAKPLGPVD